MARLVNEIISSWASGVVTTAEADSIPKAASPRGLNSALFSAVGEQAISMKRRGLKTFNTTAIAGTPAVIQQFLYKRLASGALTNYHLLFTDNGRVEQIDTSGALTNVATGLTQTVSPDVAQYGNIAYFVNGSYRKKIQSESPPTLIMRDFGIVRPTVGTMVGSAVSTGGHNGTYELRVSFYSSHSDNESSMSDTATATVVTVNQDISWTNVPTSSDAQVTHRFLYVRNINTMANFYKAGEIANNSGTTATTDITDNALTVNPPGPSLTENDPPPSGIKYCESHSGRMFVADDSTLYYSKVDKPEAFPLENAEPIGPEDGTRIKGLFSFQDLLLILKENSTWVVIGDDPDTWSIEIAEPTSGTTSHRSIMAIEGKVYWWSEQGPMVWTPGDSAVNIGQTLIAPTVGPDIVDFNLLDNIHGAIDFPRSRLIWAVAEKNRDGEPTATRNNIILPFNYRLQRWDSNRWDPMDAASFGVVDDSTGQPWVYLGGYKGQLFRLWDADNDGSPTGSTLSGSPQTPPIMAVTSITRVGSVATVTTTSPHGLVAGMWVTIAGANETEYNGAFKITMVGGSTFDYTVPGSPATPATGTITAQLTPDRTIYLASATFTTTGAGLRERYVYIVTPGSSILRRRRIGSNTSTALSLDDYTWPVTPTSNDMFFVAGIDWQWDTYWFLHQGADMGAFTKKRHLFCYSQLKTPQASTVVNLDVYTNYSDSPSKLITFTVNPGGAIWDQSLWDQSLWADQAAVNFRSRLGLTGFVIKFRYRNFKPDEPLLLLKSGVNSELLSDAT